MGPSVVQSVLCEVLKHAPINTDSEARNVYYTCTRTWTSSPLQNPQFYSTCTNLCGRHLHVIIVWLWLMQSVDIRCATCTLTTPALNGSFWWDNSVARRQARALWQGGFEHETSRPGRHKETHNASPWSGIRRQLKTKGNTLLLGGTKACILWYNGTKTETTNEQHADTRSTIAEQSKEPLLRAK